LLVFFRGLEAIALVSLLVHGWPGSVVEFQKVIPLLTTPRPDQDFVFEVVAPSLPGFGYSSQAAKPGLSALNMAHILKNLMLRLGHEKYYTQGGDWGAAVTAYMATVYPEQ
jgi:pimeloyl-ACP methyl ester carboxylesterase